MVQLQLVSNLPASADAKIIELGGAGLLSVVAELRAQGVNEEGLALLLIVQRDSPTLRVVKSQEV
jgi:hypothetical protein